MMLNREYYQLEDLKQCFNLTESDIRYLVSERKITPCFYIQNSTFIIGGWRKSEFIGFANVEYEGLVAIPQQYIRQFIENGQVTPQHYILRNRSKIRLLSNRYSCDLPLPNNYIQYWESKELSLISWPHIPAKLYPYASAPLAHTFRNMLLDLTPDLTNAEMTNRLDTLFGGTPNAAELTALFKTFRFSAMCVSHEDLVANGIVQTLQTPAPKLAAADSKKFQFDNEFEDLIATILAQHSKIPAKKIHRILCDECNREEDSRLYDKNNILLGEDQGVISWRDKYRNNRQRSYSQSSLVNIVSQVRKTLGQPKDAAPS